MVRTGGDSFAGRIAICFLVMWTLAQILVPLMFMGATCAVIGLVRPERVLPARLKPTRLKALLIWAVVFAISLLGVSIISMDPGFQERVEQERAAAAAKKPTHK